MELWNNLNTFLAYFLKALDHSISINISRAPQQNVVIDFKHVLEMQTLYFHEIFVLFCFLVWFRGFFFCGIVILYSSFTISLPTGLKMH